MNSFGSPPSSTHTPASPLSREVGLAGAVLLGLGSIIGTGVFVSIGIAAGIAGPSVVLAILLAAIVAACNGLSSAQLAAAYPVSGGTYEYGYRVLTPSLGFLAGWMFLCAKSASAATAALGFAAYFLYTTGLAHPGAFVPLAVGAVMVLTLIVAGGIRRSNLANGLIVGVTLFGLVVFCVVGHMAMWRQDVTVFQPFFTAGPGMGGVADVLHAAALMFVAFTGYGRIATLGEEVTDPRRTIPRAIIITLIVSSLLYITVAAVAVGAIGAEALAGATSAEVAPLVVAARAFQVPFVAWLVSLAAITAMLGVLLNLLLGLSRVVLAMARRGDMPPALAAVAQRNASPVAAVLACGAVIALLTLTGNVKLTWSLSALTVLVYYALTNLAALRMPAEHRLYPRAIAALGLLGCLGLAVWIEPQVWLYGAVVAGAGLLWHAVARRCYAKPLQ